MTDYVIIYERLPIRELSEMEILPIKTCLKLRFVEDFKHVFIVYVVYTHVILKTRVKHVIFKCIKKKTPVL